MHSIKQSISKKVGAGTRVLLKPFQQYGSQNEFCCCLYSSSDIFSKDSCITCRKKTQFRSFFNILSYLILNSTFRKCTAYSYISFDMFKTFLFHDFFSRINVFSLLFPLFKGHIFWTYLFCRKDCFNLPLHNTFRDNGKYSGPCIIF